ncbi:YobI family P-loop NTPase [Gemella morbillorum]
MEKNKNIKNSHDTIRNTQFMSLSPTIVEKLEKVYVDALDFVIENENIKNAAISGHYGSGKSSIWQTYKNMRNINNVIYISLGDYCQGDEEGNSISRIEKQILTQILAQVNQKDIPLSKYKLKFNKNKCTIAKYVLVSLIFILSIIGWFIKAEITSIYMIRMHVYLSFIILLFVTPLIYLIYRIFKGELFQISKINLKIAEANAQPSDEKDESIFDKDIKEIIYILKSSNVKYVVFEDLDRYDNVLIFSKLRELNYLLNADRSKQDSNIKFIYMVRDDLFDVQTRSKFFDFILPVISIVDSENSEGKLMEYFKDNNNIPDKKVLRKISIYIDDMRILKNIVNEFNIYSEILLPQKLNLDNNKLFSIIVLKNIFPEEFSLLQRDRGYIFNIFRELPYYKENVSREIEEEIIENESNLKELENEVAVSEAEVMSIMLPGNLTTGNRNKWSEYLKEWNENPKQERNVDGWYINYDKFLDKYINNNPNNKKRLDNLKNKRGPDLDKLRNKITKFKTYLDEINAQSLKEFLNSIDENKLTNIIENKENDSVIIDNHYFPLIRFLLMEGLIDESYRLYLSIFRAGSLTVNDKIFLSNILSANKSDLLLEINSPKSVYEELADYHYRRKAIQNLKFLEWLIENDKKIEVINITKHCLDRDLIFILSKLSNQNIMKYSKVILEDDLKLFKKVLQINNFENYLELYKSLVLSILQHRFTSVEDLKSFSNLVEKSESVLRLLSGDLEIFSKNLNFGIIKFNNICIEGLDKKVLRIITENNAYKISINNIKFILEMKLREKVDLSRLLSTINRSKVINKYVHENLVEFLNQYISLGVDTFHDDEENVISILKSELEPDFKNIYLEKNATILSNISSISDIDGIKKVLRILISNNTMKFNENNISVYWEIISEIDDQFVKYLEVNLREDNKDIILENDDLCYELTSYKNVSDKILNLLRVNQVEE